MYAEPVPGEPEEDEGSLQRRIWRRSDVVLGFAGIFAGLGFVLLVSFVLALVQGGATSSGADLPGALVTLLFEASLGVVVVWLAARRRLPLSELGLRRRPDVGRVVGALVGAYATLIVYQVVLSLIARAGVNVSHFDQGNPLPTGPSTSPVVWVLLGFAVIVVAPVAEELFFRAFVFRAAAGAFPIGVAYVIGGVAFASFHLNLSVLVPFTVIGAFFAWSYWRSGSLWTSISAHAIVNTASFVLTIMGMSR